jgi:hypothetical protein
MKLRQGFVSNSSTTSFCIYGIYISADDKSKVRNHFNKDVESLFRGTGLEVHYGSEYDDGMYIGMPWTRVGDDQTGKQFKQAVEDALKAVLKDSVAISCSSHKEAWYNG